MRISKTAQWLYEELQNQNQLISSSINHKQLHYLGGPDSPPQPQSQESEMASPTKRGH